VVQFPLPVVTVVVMPSPLPVVVTALLVLPLPEFTVTELGPVELAETFPPPAVTVLDIVLDGGCSPAFRWTTLQPLWLDADLLESSAAKVEPLKAPANSAAARANVDFFMACLSHREMCTARSLGDEFGIARCKGR
jgi:hypothetical protein